MATEKKNTSAAVYYRNKNTIFLVMLNRGNMANPLGLNKQETTHTISVTNNFRFPCKEPGCLNKHVGKFLAQAPIHEPKPLIWQRQKNFHKA